MSRNNQVLLEEIVKQELVNFEEDISISDFFEFYSALQILKEFELSYEEVQAGITGESHDGGVGAELMLDVGDSGKKVGTKFVHFVGKTNSGDRIFVGLAPDSF